MYERTIGIQLEVLSERMVELYFIKRDYVALLGFLSKDITWMSAGQKEICCGLQEAKTYFQESMQIYDGSYLIKESSHRGIEVRDDVGIVLSILTIQTPKDAKVMISMKLNFSLSWKKEHGLWKIYHIHYSFMDEKINDGNAYILERVRNSYDFVKEELNKASHTDCMTGINNMNGFIQECERVLAREPCQRFIILKFGIRNFRYINRIYGYSFGDKVLKNIAKNIKKSCRQDEACARIEKDIFAMMYKFKDKNTMDKRIESVRQKLVDKRILNKLETPIDFYAGVYITGKDERISVIDMLDKAFIAQQSISKRQAGSEYVYYDEWMLEHQLRKSHLIESIHLAIRNEEFQLYIQPQYDIHNGQIVSGEALCRWIKDEEVVYSPDEFIPLMEENGMILTFDFYMLEMLCKQMKIWLNKEMQTVPISINQSGLHIGQENYLKEFCEIVDRYEIPHNLISFELTESTFVDKQDEMLKLASQLHQLGFLLAIDDFGTGYASLNLLSVISADILKIDKSLLDDISENVRARSILRKVIELAHDIDMNVICEGIETREQWEFLKDIDCDIGQGYFKNPALCICDFQTLL